MDSQPIFLFPRNSISQKSLKNLLDRLNQYGSTWSQQHPTKIVVYIQRSRDLDELLQSRQYDFLSLIPLGRYFLLNIFFPLFNRGFRPEKVISITLICGDLFVAPFMARLANLSKKRKHSIQISIHGNPNMNNTGFTRIVKKLLIMHAIRVSSSIRIVSKQLADEILKDYDTSKKYVFVAPIPTQLPKVLEAKVEGSLLAFVGRVHNERNPAEWSEITKRFLNSEQSAKAIVIGNGVLLEEMKCDFDRILRERIDFVGEVDHKNLDEYWPGISILLTTAVSEGFGLTIREALIRGVFVVARENSVTSFMANTYNGIFTYQDVNMAFEIIHSLSGQTFAEHDRLKNIELVLSENSLSLNKLLKSWI